MKERLIKMLSILGVISLFVVGVYAADIKDDCFLDKGYSSAETISVGVSKSAHWLATGYSDSTYGSFVDIYAAWTGWTYTREYSGSVFANGKLEYTESQENSSSYYLKLRAMNSSYQSHSYGFIKAN